VIIKGKVAISYIKEDPYLERMPEPRTDTRTNRLRYGKLVIATSPYAETFVLLVYEEPEAPEFERRTRIVLPGDWEFVIESQAQEQS
jgi:hypothetical protein